MAEHLRCSIDSPIREGLSWSDLWEGSDKGLIWCWERGRQKRAEQPDLAARASRGELVTLVWQRGTLNYLAMWQGLRREDLEIALDGKREIVCTKTGKGTIFPSPKRR